LLIIKTVLVMQVLVKIHVCVPRHGKLCSMKTLVDLKTLHRVWHFLNVV
jgi:hypothetical protein